MTRRLILALTAALGLALPARAQTRYTVTNLGTLGGPATSSSIGYAVNNSGMVTGSSATAVPGQEHAFRSSAAGGPVTLTDLGTFGGQYSRGYAINDAGMVSGASSYDDSNVLNAFRSSAAGAAGPAGLTNLGTFGGPTSLGFGINARGEVAGGALDRDYHAIAFRSAAAGVDVPLTNPIEPWGGEGYAINDRGMVAGQYQINVGIYHAFRSPATGDGTRRTDLGTLEPGVDGFRLNSVATGINASGAASGYSETYSGTRAFRSAAVGEPNALTNLGTLGGENSFGQGINDGGLVVGYSEYDATRKYRAFVFDTRMRDLNDLVDDLTAAGFKELTVAYGISDTGFITGYGTTLDGSTINAFLLTPTLTPAPEPSAVLGVAAAGLGLAGWVRRRAAPASV